jgi:hypothetical protein
MRARALVSQPCFTKADNTIVNEVISSIDGSHVFVMSSCHLDIIFLTRFSHFEGLPLRQEAHDISLAVLYHQSRSSLLSSQDSHRMLIIVFR